MNGTGGKMPGFLTTLNEAALGRVSFWRRGDWGFCPPRVRCGAVRRSN
jgi:hypothetical protein